MARRAQDGVPADARGVITLSDGTVVPRRRAFRSWMMENITMDQIMKIHPCTKCYQKLVVERGYPQEFFWPVFGDYDGASLLIDAVMNKDAEKIQTLNARFPDFDFGLGEWWTELKAEFVRQSAVQRTTLRSVTVGLGRTLRAEAEVDMDTGIRTIRHSFYRGKVRVASKVIAVNYPEKKAKSHG